MKRENFKDGYYAIIGKENNEKFYYILRNEGKFTKEHICVNEEYYSNTSNFDKELDTYREATLGEIQHLKDSHKKGFFCKKTYIINDYQIF